LREQRENRQSQSKRVEETEGGETIPEYENRGIIGRRDNPKVGEFKVTKGGETL
jgi:hypothetical protein